MPLNTQVIRDGEPLSVRWGQFHVAAMTIAASIDDPSDPRSIFEDKTIDRPDFELPDHPEVPEEWRGCDSTGYPDVPCQSRHLKRWRSCRIRASR